MSMTTTEAPLRKRSVHVLYQELCMLVIMTDIYFSPLAFLALGFQAAL